MFHFRIYISHSTDLSEVAGLIPKIYWRLFGPVRREPGLVRLTRPEVRELRSAESRFPDRFEADSSAV